MIALAAALWSCGGRPASYSTNTAIPLGHVTLQVGRFGAADSRSMLVRTAAPEDRIYAVDVSVSGLDSIDDPIERHHYISNFLERQLALVDADGDRFRPARADAEPLFQDRYWVVSFDVPEVSRDFTLQLRNPDPQPDQPATAAVHLGTPRE